MQGLFFTNSTAVYGITVRARNVASMLGAGLKSLAGGEVGVLTTNMVRCRDEAMDRMIAGVHQVGGNAVYAFRFDVNSPEPGWTEVCCYGTAVTAVPRKNNSSYQKQ
ncbi:hypothetical protein AWJ20_3418 [Sugiyamaella lignohabitans]|uniref:Uncharacterized protein n=1 Tax=Sugiyamaella lignohabitans TaxID=796027 RepID=A0A167FW40_9ASCO|nr:uncharacterized protein AWJ20_3418 [Sugiyamaella lignohabitans]ANB15774.1 hypothetical protein AWJ20_3418 [Sugiyamaella lignohabitans]